MSAVLVFLTDKTIYVVGHGRNKLSNRFVLPYAELDVILMGPMGNTVLLSNMARGEFSDPILSLYFRMNKTCNLLSQQICSRFCSRAAHNQLKGSFHVSRCAHVVVVFLCQLSALCHWIISLHYRRLSAIIHRSTERTSGSIIQLSVYQQEFWDRMTTKVRLARNCKDFLCIGMCRILA